MPGTPATSPRHGVPRVANTDTFDIARDVNAAIDRFDITAQRVDFGLAAARPTAGIANRFYYATDTNQLTRDTGSAWVNAAPNAHAATHQDGGADPLIVREAMMATGAPGLAKGSFSAYRNAAQTVTNGNAVLFDTEEWDVSNWFDPVAARYMPQVAGYYRLSWCVTLNGALAADTFAMAALYKNGVEHRQGQMVFQRGTISMRLVGTAGVQANGVGDYFTVVLSVGVASAPIQPGAAFTRFDGQMVGRS